MNQARDRVRYHLTARPWQPLGTPVSAYLDTLESICRGAAGLPDAFAYAAAVLAAYGRTELLENGMRAMDHACEGVGIAAAAPLAGALALYGPHAAPERRARWAERLRVPVSRLPLNHRRTLAMKGEWARAREGLVNADLARHFIERQWIESQRERVTGDPESHGLEAVGRNELLALAADGYDGPSAAEIRAFAERGTAATLFMQDPSGQCPPDIRNGGQALHDVLYQLAFEVMAESAPDPWTAGQYRRAAMLSFHSMSRRGSSFEEAMYLAEAWLTRASEIAERPAPAEIGGYALVPDQRFATAFANAGGLHMAANLRGDTVGVVRFARTGWDARLGPSGVGRGVSFAPSWMEAGRWVRMADAPARYQGTFRVLLAHPMLVRCAIDYTPVAGYSGPAFRHDFTITPDAVLAAQQAPPVAVTWPLLENDGEPIETAISTHIASVRRPGGSDEQHFIALASRPDLTAEEPVRGPYGWLRPVRSRSAVTIVYPRSPGDPTAEAVRASYRPTPQGFVTVLGRVTGNLYVGRTAAGGEGKSIDLNGDGRPEVVFSAPCGFILQLENGRVRAVEADREVRAVVEGRRLALAAFQPVWPDG